MTTSLLSDDSRKALARIQAEDEFLVGRWNNIYDMDAEAQMYVQAACLVAVRDFSREQQRRIVMVACHALEIITDKEIDREGL